MRTWLLLRGLTREAGHWGDFPALLQERLGAGHQVRTADLPGCGTRWQERSPASVAGIAQACRATQAEQGGGAPMTLVALSLGAMVALEWARQAPHEVAGCALVNTSLRGHSPFWQRLRPAHYPRLLRLLAPGRDPLSREREILAMTSARAADHAGVPERWAAIAARRPVATGNALRQLVAAGRYAAPRERPPAPLLLVCSAGDRLVSPQCSHRLASRWQVPLQVHPAAGHDLPLDDGPWLVQRLLDWAVRRPTGV